MVKRRRRLVITLTITGGVIVIVALVLHNLLYGSAIASIDVGGGYMPLSLAVDSTTDSAYVSGPDGSITTFSTKNGANARTTPAPPGRPRYISVAVAPRLERVYVAHGYNTIGIPGDELDILDAHSQQLLYRRRVRNLSGYMAVDEPTNTLFVATQTGISRLDARTGRLLGWTWSSGPNAVAVDQRTQHVFVPVGGRGSVTMLDARSGRVLRTVSVSSDPHYIAVDERASRVYVLSYDTTLSVIDTRTGALLKTSILHPSNNGSSNISIATDVLAGRVIVCEGTRAHVLDAWSVREVALVNLGGSAYGECGIAVDEAAHVAYISSSGGFKAIDTRTGAVLSSQGAVDLRGGQVAVDTVSHHVVVDGPHFGLRSVLAPLRGIINGLMHREFWVTDSPDYTWSVSILHAAR